MLKQLTIALVVGLGLALAPASATLTVEIDFANLNVSYNPVTDVLSVTETTSSTAYAAVVVGGNTKDAADIYNAVISPGTFEVSFASTVVNPAGLNNIALINGTFWSTDTLTSQASPSILADAENIAYGLDPDGIVYENGTLSVHGRLSTVGGNLSILLNPAGGDWTYSGEDDGGFPGGGLDGVADQITVSDSGRDGYDSGALAMFKVGLSTYADGTAIVAGNADELFAGAENHGGFAADRADMKIEIIPAPAAVLLGLTGLGLVGWRMRKYA